MKKILCMVLGVFMAGSLVACQNTGGSGKTETGEKENKKLKLRLHCGMKFRNLFLMK